MMENILIADDVTENIQVLGFILGKEKYSVSFATNGKKALEMVMEESFDLILLDIMMPDMDGVEVCRRIKRIPEKAGIPVIFLTAKAEKSDIVCGFEAGAVDYITKPFNAHELLARVRTHLELKKSRDVIQERSREIEIKNKALETLNSELREALEKIRTLEGILPICSFCNKIRDDAGYWKRLDAYISEHSKAVFSHGICPECMKTHYPEYMKKDKKD